MLQDIAPKKLFNEFLILEPQAEDYVVIYQDGKVLLKVEVDGMRIPTYKEIERDLKGHSGEYTYALCVDEHSFFLLRKITGHGMVQTDYEWHTTRIFRTLQPTWMSFATITVCQLSRWYKSRTFCGVCGSPMQPSTSERAMICKTCGQIEYPKISPAVIVGVLDGDKIMMTRYANRTFKRYALIAGFTEIGETLEETVEREVMEEVGVKVKNIRYFGNQPWSFTDTLLVGFFADLDGDNTVTLDREELAEADWFTKEDMPEDEEQNISLTYTMMHAFKTGNYSK